MSVWLRNSRNALPFNDQVEKFQVWQFFDFSCSGYFVEVGANAPGLSAQTWQLERIGWKGALVEPLPDKAALNRRLRTDAYVFEGVATSPERAGTATLHVAENDGSSSTRPNADDHGIRYTRQIEVKARTLDDILAEAGATRVDFLSIDTEGTELDVLRGFDVARWRPRLILVEDKLTRLDKHRYLGSVGYRLVKRTSYLNDWYVPRDAAFTLTDPWERLKLLRKVYLGLPFRALRRWRHHRKSSLIGSSSASLTD